MKRKVNTGPITGIYAPYFKRSGPDQAICLLCPNSRNYSDAGSSRTGFKNHLLNQHQISPADAERAKLRKTDTKLTEYFKSGFMDKSWQMDLVRLVCKQNIPMFKLTQGVLAEWFHEVHGFKVTDHYIETAIKHVEGKAIDYIKSRIKLASNMSFTIDEWSSCCSTFRTFSNINIYLDCGKESIEKFCFGNSKFHQKVSLLQFKIY